jgi:ferredoxin
MSDYPDRIIDDDRLAALMRALADDGYRLAGPTVADGAVTLDLIDGLDDLPDGGVDEQAPGRYRYDPTGGEGRRFAYVVGPQSWKRFLFPPEQTLFTVTKEGPSFTVEPPEPAPAPYAFIGVRPCELSAMAAHDQIFTGGAAVDTPYADRRSGVFVAAVNCARPGGACFCASMGTGPTARSGFDIALTELAGRRYLATTGSDRGAALLDRIGAGEADESDRAEADAVMDAAARRMGKQLATDGLPEALAAAADLSAWKEVGERCLSCGNCALVCPTCFCSVVVDANDLTGDRSRRVRRWDVCFTTDFSYVHGGAVRTSSAARYRHWITHKLSTWHDQFGRSGCVGCGRCVTWCPVGIDIVAEATRVMEEREGR